MGNLLFCFRGEKDYTTTKYGDYIFHHEELLKIQVSELLATNLKIDDYISLKVCLDGQLVYHNCKICFKTKNEIYVSFMQACNDFSEIEYITKL